MSVHSLKDSKRFRRMLFVNMSMRSVMRLMQHAKWVTTRTTTIQLACQTTVQIYFLVCWPSYYSWKCSAVNHFMLEDTHLSRGLLMLVNSTCFPGMVGTWKDAESLTVVAVVVARLYLDASIAEWIALDPCPVLSKSDSKLYTLIILWREKS